MKKWNGEKSQKSFWGMEGEIKCSPSFQVCKVAITYD